MDFKLKATHVDITDNLRQEIHEKLDELEKFVSHHGPDVMWFVEVGKTTEHHKEGKIYKAEVNVTLPHHVIRAEAISESISMALTEVKDRMQAELKKYKDKQITKNRKEAREFKDEMHNAV